FRSMLGVRPNLMWMGASVFAKATENAKVLDRMKYTQVAVPTAADLARLFEIPEVLVGDAVYCDDDDVFHDVWGDSMGFCYVPKSQNANQYEPSFMYTLAKKNGQFVDSYPENGGKLEILRYTDIFVEKIVGAEAGFLVSDCIADA
ncbi:MAG TPA: hypothetical protein VLH18_05400, partial [Candidatus Limnocylindrales bacterium]|nr:hypothetical protein [Candidatus Limnocylindrales bacterium]